MSAPILPSEDDDADYLKGDGAIVQRAHERFLRCKDWYDNAYRNLRQDTMFANADARNNWQWPERVFNQRDGDDRPCLTINKTRLHNRMVINEALQNKASVQLRPVGGEASFESAKVMQSLVDRIEYISKASIHYKRAITHQVEGGCGYCTLETGYVDDKSFDQDIYIRGVKDPTCVYLDPDISEPDGSDADFGFVFERTPRAKFNKKYPKFKDQVGTSVLGKDENWITDDHVMLAMFYERTNRKDELITYTLDGQEPFSGHRSEIEPELYKVVKAQIQTGELDGNIREVTAQDVKWYLIGGDRIINKGDWIGRYIPIARLPGEETIIDGRLDMKGLTRYLIDQQRMLNYNASAQIEFGALQSKTPYTGAAAAFEGQEQWKDANKKNYAFLQFNHQDDEGNDLPAQALPQRVQPPTAAPVYAQGIKDAQEQMMMASGQYQAQMGENENAKSGKAISERQRQGDTATYDFTDNQYDFYRHLGVMIIDLIPKVYDTKRIHQILAEDGTPTSITIDPDASETLNQIKRDDEGIEIIFNPSRGEYAVLSDPGPNYATQRQEAWNAGIQILQQNMELVGVIGDQIFRYGDFKGADEIADRLKKEIKATKPYLFDDNSNPQLLALQEQNKRLVALNVELTTKVADEKLKSKGYNEKRDIDAYKAETDRMKAEIDAIAKMVLTPQQVAQMQHDLGMQTHDHVFGMIRESNQETIDNEDAESEEA